MKHDEDRFLTTSAVRALYHISLTSLWRMTKAGTIPAPVKLGGKRLWDAAEIADHAARLRAARNGKGA